MTRGGGREQIIDRLNDSYTPSCLRPGAQIMRGWLNNAQDLPSFKAINTTLLRSSNVHYRTAINRHTRRMRWSPLVMAIKKTWHHTVPAEKVAKMADHNNDDEGRVGGHCSKPRDARFFSPPGVAALIKESMKNPRHWMSKTRKWREEKSKHISTIWNNTVQGSCYPHRPRIKRRKTCIRSSK